MACLQMGSDALRQKSRIKTTSFIAPFSRNG